MQAGIISLIYPASGGRRSCIRRMPHPPRRYLARTRSAALVPAKPRQRMSAILVRGTCAAVETRRPAQSGSRLVRVATPGTMRSRKAACSHMVQGRYAGGDALAQGSELDDLLDDARRGDEMPDRPLECGHRRRV